MNSTNMLFFFLSLNLFAFSLSAKDLRIVEAQEALMKQDINGFFKKIDELEKNEENAKDLALVLDEVMRECEHDKSWKNIQRAVCTSFAVLGASYFITSSYKAVPFIRKNYIENKTWAWYFWILFALYGNPQRLFLALGLVGWQKGGKDKKMMELFKQKLAAVKEQVTGLKKKTSESN